MPTERRKRVFSYEEAAALLPEVRRITDAAVLRVEELRAAAGPHDVAVVQKKVDEVVEQWAHAVLEHGVEVKGLWLVDFDNGSGYYCWRHPEEGLQFYHSYDDGFRGRMRIH